MWENDSKEYWIRWSLLFFVALNGMLLVSEIAFSFIPEELHKQAAMTWMASGVGMTLWAGFSD